MTKTLSLIAAAAVAATAIPATLAIPQTASAGARVDVAYRHHGGGYYWGGRHYRHRAWRNGAWFYYDPFVVAPAYDYGYGYAPAAGVYYYDGGRRYAHRRYVCHWNPRWGRVCKYRYW